MNPPIVAQVEEVFRRLEKLLRQMEGDMGCMVSGSGSFLKVRREFYEPLPNHLNNDFALPLSVVSQGYKSRFDKNAVVRFFFPAHQPDVLRRRKRTVILALSTMAIYRKLLQWHLRLVLFAHKTARFYAFSVQVMVLLSNLFCQMALETPFWVGLLLLQLIFYGAAVLGWLSEQLNWKIPLVFLSYQFPLQNALVFSSVINYLKGRQGYKWTPPR